MCILVFCVFGLTNKTYNARSFHYTILEILTFKIQPRDIVHHT